MYYPSKEEFIKLSEQGNLIPVYREIIADMDTPVSAFSKIDKGNYSYLLESVEQGERIGRYSFLGSNPSLVITTKGSEVTIEEGNKKRKISADGDPLKVLKEELARYKFIHTKGLPRFCGGLVGYAGYDMVRFFEKLPDKNPDDLNVPDSVWMLTDTILIFDHIDHKIKIVSNAHLTPKKKPSVVYDQAVAQIDRIAKALAKPLKPEKKVSHRPNKLSIRSNVTKPKFIAAVKKAKEYIKAGDIIQVVLSQRFSTTINEKPFYIYRALRSVNPSPYMFYLNMKDIKLVGSSPEILVRCEEGLVQTRPIAGTRRRGETPDEDVKLEKELLADPKERAEHIMLVDLGRNDLGRVCEFDTVDVNDFMIVERYSHVMHIVTDVTGQLDPEKDIFDTIRATFPAGTVAGAPKIRAMEIIDELETSKRGPYAGCVGYISFSGNIDTCITIRTILVKGKTAYVQAGAGIVADSQPAKEYDESVNKAKGMFRAIEVAQRGLEK
ncbi:MAG: anthranilate synthase component I [Candidatus Omnitrophica bacterium]|nr:anthranilate synthase component I [Candidatus Omnitrophota bacterium]